MVEFTIPLVLDIIRTAGIIVGIIYYLSMMKNQTKTREAQFLMQLNQVFQDKEAIKDWYEVLFMEFSDYQDYLDKFDSTVNMENYLQRSRIYRMLNNFGHIVKRGLVDPEAVYDGIQGGFVVDMWKKHGLLIREFRVQYNKPSFQDGFEINQVSRMVSSTLLKR
jgi:hypothetical protein